MCTQCEGSGEVAAVSVLALFPIRRCMPARSSHSLHYIALTSLVLLYAISLAWPRRRFGDPLPQRLYNPAHDFANTPLPGSTHGFTWANRLILSCADVRRFCFNSSTAVPELWLASALVASLLTKCKSNEQLLMLSEELQVLSAQTSLTSPHTVFLQSERWYQYTSVFFSPELTMKQSQASTCTPCDANEHLLSNQVSRSGCTQWRVPPLPTYSIHTYIIAALGLSGEKLNFDGCASRMLQATARI